MLFKIQECKNYKKKTMHRCLNVNTASDVTWLKSLDVFCENGMLCGIAMISIKAIKLSSNKQSQYLVG